MDILYSGTEQAEGLSIQVESVVSEEEVVESDVTESADAIESEEAAPMEAEALMVADGLVAEGESPEASVEAPEEDKAALMAEMINSSIQERQTEGIYSALDNTFATLAENAAALSNPETGVIETDGNAIVNTTFDALSQNFDATPEELMGAIGAAAARADGRSYLNVLGGDPALISMTAASTTSEQVQKEVLKGGKIGYDSFLEAMALKNPAFRPYVPPFKAIGGELFGSLGSGQTPPP